MLKKQTSLDYVTLKINVDITFGKNKIDINIFIKSYFDVSLFSKAIPQYDNFLVNFEKFLRIIEDYIVGIPFTAKFFIKYDSLITINSLNYQHDYLFDLGGLASNFLNRISSSFSHVKRKSNVPVLLNQSGFTF